MKSGNENDTKLAVANEGVNKVTGAVIAVNDNLSAFSPARQDLEDIAVVLVDVMNVLERTNSLQNITPKDIEGLEKKAESIKSRSSIGVKIKAWFNSWFIPLIKFLKSPFSKQHKEELQQATEDFVKGTEDIQKQTMQEQVVQEQIATTIPTKEPPVQPSLMETPKPQAVISTTAPLAVQETTHSIQDVAPTMQVVVNSSTPTMPLVQVTASTPTVMPPPVQVIVHSTQGVPPPPPPPPPPSTAPIDPLAALRGKEKKSVNQAVAEPVEDMVSELKKKLAERMVKAGEVEFKPGSPEHLKEFAEFDKLRKDETARQARQDEIDAPRIAAALKAEAEKQAASTKVPPKVEFNKEVGVPIPPPPPPMPGAAGVQPPKPVVKKPPAMAAAKVQAKPVQLAVDKDAIIEAVKGLKKLSKDSTHKKPTEKPVINFKAHLKTREGSSR